MENKLGIDCVFVIPSNSKKSYQKLSETYSAIEPPTWALLLAQSIRSVNLSPRIIDAAAENLNDEEIFKRIKSMSPKLICIVVYGQNVNAGTTNMSGAAKIINYLKDNKIGKSISLIGSHAQALPKEILKKEKNIDFIFTNEGVYALRNILKLKDFSISSLKNIKGIAFRQKNNILINPPEKVVPTERMDIDLPGYAWDQIQENIEAAEKQRESSESKLKEYNNIILKSESEAKNIFKEAREKILKDINSKKEILDKQIDDEIKKAENEISELRRNAPDKINKIAIETSSELIKKLLGTEVNNSSISAIVNDFTKRNGDKYYDD